MMRFIAFLLILPVFAMATEYLVSIPVDIRQVEGQKWLSDINILRVGTDYLIARVDENNLAPIPRYTILDTDPQQKEYLQVYAPTDEGKARVRSFGTVLFESNEFLLLRKEREFPTVFNMDGIFAIVPLRMEPIIIGKKIEYTPEFEPKDIVAEIVSKVSENSYIDYIQKLQDFATRYSKRVDVFKNVCLYVQETYESFGYNTYLFYFDLINQGYYPCSNVVAEKSGKLDPTKIFILCGHLDSTTSTNPYDLAPGGDDNASGSAAAMEGARVMSGYNFKYTLRFVNFGAEEQGLVGSHYYAKDAYDKNEDIAGVVNLDMVLYAPAGSVAVWVPYDTNSEWLAEYFTTASHTYVPDLSVETQYDPGMTYSDHAPFWSYGYPAILEIEKAVWTNPYYHKTSDRLENYLNYFPFGTNATKAAIAVVASLAEPLGGADVNLEYFTAKSDENGVLLSWNTIEKNQPSFNIYKLDEESWSNGGLDYGIINTIIEGNWLKLNDRPISGKGPFSFTDTEAKEGEFCRYRLDAIEDKEDKMDSTIGTTSIRYSYSEPLSISSVYPTPCYDSATVLIKGTDDDLITYRIYDISGRSVSEGSAGVTDSKISLSLSGLQENVYLLEISNGDRRATAKIVHVE